MGGIVMLVATAAALVWANSPWDATYEKIRDADLEILGLHLTTAEWSSAGLLTLFFFVAGLEVKEELVHGDLRDPRKAALPIAAAAGGMICPALVYLAISWNHPGGWAVPVATDIAFALAVLAVTASALPPSLRAFLLTMAVIDDLGAIAIIAIFYPAKLDLLPLLGAVALLAVYGYLQRRQFSGLWLYLPIGIATWVCVELSGIHATAAGVALALLTRTSVAERADHHIRPLSAGLAVPIFAFTAAGVSLSGSAFSDVLSDRIALGIIGGLVIGKFLGVFGGAWLAARLGLARISDDLFWRDLAAVAMLAGVGFTVSLLIGGLAYPEAPQSERVTTAVLIGSLLASVIAAVLLRLRVRQHVT